MLPHSVRYERAMLNFIAGTKQSEKMSTGMT